MRQASTLIATQTWCLILILLFITPCSETLMKANKNKKSTCQTAHQKCEMSENCRWHLSELQMKCPHEDCVRNQCTGAMRRISRYVHKSLLESLMFCQCAFSDINCKALQNSMYPRCLYDTGRTKPKWTCTQTVKLCEHDSYCFRSLRDLNETCPLSPGPAGGCLAKNLAECRLALIKVRGTDLESPCYCNEDDEKCLEYMNMVMPNNPCVEEAMIDFVESGSIATAGDRELSTVKPSSRRNQKKLKLKSTTTSTTTTTDTPNYENESESEDSNELEQNGSKEADLIKSTTEVPIKESNVTVAKEIRTNMPSKGIKISKKPGSSTTKIISGQPLVTQTPPPKEGGCETRNIDGDWIRHYKNSVFRQYNDLAGRCSSYCECSDDENTTCSPLSCMDEGSCETPQTTIHFGERLFIEGRGACLCHSGKFICDSSDEVVELDPGLYISLGFSREELKMIKEKVPKPILEKCGLVSPEISVQNDIASRLQFALERLMPKGMLCRVALIERYSRESVMLLQIQWYGIDKYTNSSEKAWHVGKLEKICSPYVRKLENQFLLEGAARYQLVLSVVKQLRVYDLLNGLPATSTSNSVFHCQISVLILSLLLIATNRIE